MLSQIISKSLQELEYRKRNLPLAELKKMVLERPLPIDLASALRGKGVKLVAEVKKASPSRGVIRSDFDPVKIAQIYADNGAAAISVLTETKYFQGSIEHLRDIKKTLGAKRLPLLRKDFLLDSYQVYQSRAYGADGVLLIVAILTPDKLQELLGISRELNMSCLVEVHNEAEVEIALENEAKIIGINNRDLNTFKVDFATSERLRPLIPPDRIVVSESGIKDRSDIEKCRHLGIDAVLVGESLMSAPDIVARMKELL
jgi:indole-3-glycerol phosphate synthase